MIMRRVLNSPSYGWRSPFEELERVKRHLEGFSRNLENGLTRGRWSGVFPLVNVAEDKDSYQVRAELPGLRAEDMDISVTGKNLAITGERKILPETKEAKYHRREREAGKFSRVLALPGEVDNDKVEARLTDGILTVVLPKAEAAKPRQISVQ